MADNTDIEIGTLGELLHDITEPYSEAQDSVKSRTVTTAPSAPLDRDRYIIPSGAVGGWAGRTNQLATFLNSTWNYVMPREGTSVWIDDEDRQVTFNGSQWVTTSSSGALPSVSNKGMRARTTTGDYQLGCDVALQFKPLGGYIRVFINGIAVPDLGNGVRAGVSAFFSGDGGATARQWKNIASGDTFHWVGSVAGFQLAPSDFIDFEYQVEGA